MKLLEVQKSIQNEKVILTGLVFDNSGAQKEIRFSYPADFHDFVAEEGDAFVPCLLVPSMFYNEDLEIVPPISEKLYNNLNAVQAIYWQMYPDLFKKIKVTARTRKIYPESVLGNVGCFFSRGVDSSFSLYKDVNRLNPNNPLITHLIFMKGTEQKLGAYEHHAEAAVIEEILKIAKATNKVLIVGETNYRDTFPIGYGEYYYGAGLASIALSLGAGLSHILIPSTHAYGSIVPWGSNPMLDPLFSTERSNIIHDGAEAERAEKIADFLSQSSMFMDNLRGCTRNGGENICCGKCDKCKFTMLALYISGNLDKSKLFPRVSLRKLPVIGKRTKHHLCHYEEVLRLARRYGSEKWLIRSLKYQIDKAKVSILLDEMSIFRLIWLSISLSGALVRKTVYSKLSAIIYGIARAIIPDRQRRKALKKLLGL